MATACRRAVAQDSAVDAELSHELIGDRLATHSIFLLRVRSPWKSGDCRLLPGSLLHATVETASYAPNGHTIKITFKVDAPCADLEPLALVVTSLLAPPKVETRLEQFPGFGSFGGGGTASPANASQAATFSGADTMRGIAQVVTSTTVITTKLPPTVRLGEVWHLPHIALALPTGTGTISTISTERGSLRLPEGAVFVLQTARKAAQPLSQVSAVGGQRSVAQATRSIQPFLRPCRPEDCSAYPAKLPTTSFGFQSIGPDNDLTPFGFIPEHDRHVSVLGLDATVHFTDEDELLLTFPTHQLVKRTGKERPTDEPRSIRAVLFDTKTRSATRVVDWIVDDENRYVWPSGRNLIVHVSDSLWLYGPGMQELASLKLASPLASLRVSPDGEHILLGELHELHSEEDHRALLESDNHGPQEEVSWSLLNGHLERLRILGTSSSFVQSPVLSNAGIVELRKGSPSEWSLVSKAWEGGNEKQLGSLRSSCTPVLDGLSPDLLTVRTCDPSADVIRTYVVRTDGSTLLVQSSGDQEMPTSFVASNAAKRIATVLTRTTQEYTHNLLFHLGVIQGQTVEIVGTERGAIVARVPVPYAAPYQEPVALSPDGHTLAVLSGHILSLYTLQ